MQEFNNKLMIYLNFFFIIQKYNHKNFLFILNLSSILFFDSFFFLKKWNLFICNILN
jgi:hypothetical protein